jgi:Protein of unknown function (DUF3383)
MSLADLVNIQISSVSNLPSQAGFGVPLIACHHTHYTDLVRYYSSLVALTADGFTATSDAYLAASEILDQSPTVTSFAIGRRASITLQVLNLICGSASNLDTYKCTIVDSAGVSHNLSVASTGVPATDAATIATAITAFTLANTTVTHTSATVTLTTATGSQNDIQFWSGAGVSGQPNFTLSDTTADPGLAADLAAILGADPTGWYGLCLTCNSPAEALSCAAFAEANKKLAAVNCSDSAISAGTSGNVFLLAQTAGYTRTAFIFSGSQVKSYAGAAALGRNLPPAPGSITWAYKALTGVDSDTLSETQTNNIFNAGGNYYTSFKGVAIMYPGQSPSGEFMDIVQGIDWLQDKLQTDIFALFVGSAKVPMTDAGGDQVLAIIKADLQVAVNAGFLNGGNATTPGPIASVPLVASLSASQRAARKFVGSTFSAHLAGAMHTLTLTGTVSA